MNKGKPLFKLGKRDFLKGLVVAVITSFLGALISVLEAKGFDIGYEQWMNILNTAVIAGLSYLSKNLLSDEDDKVGGVF